MRDYEKEFEKRVDWIRSLVESAHASGVVFGNSGGKDSALVGVLCKAACENTVGVLLPCGSKRSYGAESAATARTPTTAARWRRPSASKRASSTWAKRGRA